MNNRMLIILSCGTDNPNRATRALFFAMDVLNKTRAEDEELVAIVENNACGVDALQCLSGCTFGKGNLLFKDYGNDKESRRGYGKHLKGGRFSCATAI